MPDRTTAETCLSCRFWRANRQGRVSDTHTPAESQCLREYPVSYTPALMTKSTDWCGRYEAFEPPRDLGPRPVQPRGE